MKATKLPEYARALGALGRLARQRHQLAARVSRPAGELELADGATLRLAARIDLLVLKETVCDDVYRLRGLVRPRLIVDVGAGIGDFTILAARAFPDCRVLAFEPDPAAFALLEGNVRRNGVRNAEVHRLAISPDPRCRLIRRRGRPYAAPAPAGASRQASRVIEAAGRPLEEFIGGRVVDLLKVDCEGGELDALCTLTPSSLRLVRHVAVEYHDGTGRGVAELLRRAGLDVRTVADAHRADLGYVYAVRPGSAWG